MSDRETTLTDGDSKDLYVVIEEIFTAYRRGEMDVQATEFAFARAIQDTWERAQRRMGCAS